MFTPPHLLRNDKGIRQLAASAGAETAKLAGLRQGCIFYYYSYYYWCGKFRKLF